MATLRFFDLQGIPLALLEVHKYLLADTAQLHRRLNSVFELPGAAIDGRPVSLGTIAGELEALVSEGRVIAVQGYYCLPGRQSIIRERLHNYAFGILRERRIRRFGRLLRFVPFVRGAAVGGSQALGQETVGSDIDMFVITDAKFLWLARTLVTLYFQILGVRRHGRHIANRFCLNHYLAGPQALGEERDPYNALEYLRLRAIVQPAEIAAFQNLNFDWIRQFYPNARLFPAAAYRRPLIQRAGEWLFRNRFGDWLERRLGRRQLRNIQRGEHAVATDRELSFHSRERKYKLLRQFFSP